MSFRLGDVAHGGPELWNSTVRADYARQARNGAERKRRAYVRAAGRRADGRIIRPIPGF